MAAVTGMPTLFPVLFRASDRKQWHGMSGYDWRTARTQRGVLRHALCKCWSWREWKCRILVNRSQSLPYFWPFLFFSLRLEMQAFTLMDFLVFCPDKRPTPTKFPQEYPIPIKCQKPIPFKDQAYFYPPLPVFLIQFYPLGLICRVTSGPQDHFIHLTFNGPVIWGTSNTT